MTRFQADGLLLLAAAIWGTAFFFQKTAMDHVGPLTFIACRAAVAALALAPLAWLEVRRAGAVAMPGLGQTAVFAGVLFFVAGWLQQHGLLTASVTNAGFLTSLYVIFTPFIVWAVRRRPPPPLVWAAVGLAMVGTWALGGGTIGGFGFGDALIALSAIGWAAHMVVTGAAARYGVAITFTCFQFGVVAVLAGSGAVASEVVRLSDIVAATPSVLFVGLLSSALTFTLLAVAMKHTPPSEAAILVSMETVFAAFAGALLLGERLSLIGWVGAGLMLAATILVQVAPAWGVRTVQKS